ncbi:GNAT family N-acetyltransferase [Streptosporangium saharense]|uniref:GNAT superfamily N-acetyltransferase n=1 Tax=Streptosporangium saharense TaxID=1706840 RepID=A0A7W7QVU6_9ACTN|nr:GNAT family N-acetyltransferase [Streptosporangium saharense]MBB4920703.1 GNAT superfamily N-acetyltransferase [Streptosporangium saharense]
MISVERAVRADVPILAELIGEIEAYYGGVPSDDEYTGQITALLFGAHPVAHVLLARAEDRQVLGMASYSFLWPAAGAEASLYLKELFVRPDARKRGVGRALMDALGQAAAETGCSRVEWTADHDNPAALAFYAALGAQPHNGKIFYRVQQPGGAASL